MCDCKNVLPPTCNVEGGAVAEHFKNFLEVFPDLVLPPQHAVAFQTSLRSNQ